MSKLLPLRLHLWLTLAYTLIVFILFFQKGTLPTLPELLLYLFPIFMFVVRVATGERLSP